MPQLSGTFQVGDLTVAQLSDGVERGPRQSWFTGIAPEVWTPVLGVESADSLFTVNYGAFVVIGDGHVTLVDSGFGAPPRDRGWPGGGEMLQRLAELGIQRTDVDRIVQTHLHTDHCAWLIDDEDGGSITFPNATVYLHERELAYWTGPESDGNNMAPFARSRMEPLVDAGRVTTFDAEFDVSEGITAIPTPGHTPGHCSVMVTSQGEHALLLGDVAHHPVHLERHDWLPQIDLDPAESTCSRARMAALAADRDALVTAPHMPILTLGRVRRRGDGFEYVPVLAPESEE